MVKVQARSSNLFTNRAHRNSNHVSSNPSALRDQRAADFMRAHDRIGLNGAKAGYAWSSSLTCCTRARRASSRRSIIC